MKTTLSIFSLLFCVQASAYTSWQEYTPHHILSKVNIVSYFTKNIAIYTKESINSCSALFEGNKFKVKVINCSRNGLELKIDWKNKVNCDQAMEYDKKINVKLDKECRDEFYSNTPIIINGKTFEYH